MVAILHFQILPIHGSQHLDLLWITCTSEEQTRGLQKAVDVTCLELASKKHKVKGTQLEDKLPAKDLTSFFTKYRNERIKALSIRHQRQTSCLAKLHFLQYTSAVLEKCLKDTKLVTAPGRRPNKLPNIYIWKMFFLCI